MKKKRVSVHAEEAATAVAGAAASGTVEINGSSRTSRKRYYSEVLSDVGVNLRVHLSLLKSAAPRLSPQPLLLCYPAALCCSWSVASALFPVEKSTATACAFSDFRAPLPLFSAAYFPVEGLQLNKYKSNNSTQKSRIEQQVDAASRLVGSLPHALYEVLTTHSSTHAQQPQQQPPWRNFHEFEALFVAAAEKAFHQQQVRCCDRCGADGGGESRTNVAETTSVATKQLSSSREKLALCVIPTLDVERRRLILTPPERICCKCFQVLHLPELLAASVSAVLSPHCVETKSKFSQIFAHFAAVNKLSMSSTAAAAALQQALAAAFAAASLKRHLRWGVESAFGLTLESFFAEHRKHSRKDSTSCGLRKGSSSFTGKTAREGGFMNEACRGKKCHNATAVACCGENNTQMGSDSSILNLHEQHQLQQRLWRGLNASATGDKVASLLHKTQKAKKLLQQHQHQQGEKRSGVAVTGNSVKGKSKKERNKSQK